MRRLDLAVQLKTRALASPRCERQFVYRAIIAYT